MLTTQQQRLIWRTGFFLLFLFAPILDLLRYDLNEDHLIFLTIPWSLGIADLQQVDAATLTLQMMLRIFLPLSILVVGGFYVVWKWGRLYCGWLCPHFSVVEMVNTAMRRASGKLSLWDKQTLPEHQQDGKHITPQRHWWFLTVLIVLFFSFTWAVALLTYLLPPSEVYGNLFRGTLTGNQARFIGIATLLFCIEFTFARHLFCRFGCAIGLFQSLIWMGNKRGMVVGYDRQRAKNCANCDASCEHACPMRLKPRGAKRHMFTCTQCMQCVQACEQVHQHKSEPSLLKMLEGECAVHATDRQFSKAMGCYNETNQTKRCCAPAKPIQWHRPHKPAQNKSDPTSPMG